MPKVKVNSVKIAHERFREDYGEIEQLAVSIQRYGLFHPIVVDRELNLIAGERRLRAHIALGIDEIEVSYREDADELVKREIEIEENLNRKDFTWQEEVKAKAEIDRIKRQLYGSATKGHGGGWALRDTARSLGESVGLISRDIRLADALSEYPDLKKEKNKEAAWRKLQSIKERLLVSALAEKVEVDVDTRCMRCGDSAVEMKKLESESVDLVLTDPPFGIDLRMKGKYGDVKPYEDKMADVINVIDLVVGECYRVLKNDRHMYIFCDPRNLPYVIDICRKKGFSTLETPLIWHKTGGAGAGGGDMMWARNYECIIFSYKGHRSLNRKGESDVIVVPRVAPQLKVHPTEKPTQLLRYLIEQSTMPGELVIDPFAGSASTLIAAFEVKRNAWGCEIDKGYYGQALLKIEEYKGKAVLGEV